MTSAYRVVEPPFWGTRVVPDVPLAALLPHLDTAALFRRGWGLTGPDAAELARTVGQVRLDYWLDELNQAEQRGQAHVRPALVYGYFPIQVDDEVADVLGSPVQFRFPRSERAPHTSLADLVGDVLPIQLVTVGQVASDYAAELFAADRYRDYYEFNALAGELTEALATFAHRNIQLELGLSPAESGRYSLGYPACPDLADRTKLVKLLGPERIGVTLSEEYQLHPEFSTDAFITTRSHPPG